MISIPFGEQYRMHGGEVEVYQVRYMMVVYDDDDGGADPA